MPSASIAAVVVLLVAVQTADTRGCSSGTPPAAVPAPGTPASEVFTTADGVRFTVGTVATTLEIPWSLAFAPDGRLFVTERPGRVRIVNLSTFTSEVALTINVYAQGEAGLLGIAL